MKLLYVLFVVTLALCWSPQDYEIFSLNDKIHNDVGKNVTFYSWLNLTQGPKSSLQDISKAYRKKSRQLHPDKFHKAPKGVRKLMEERYQRLSLVGNILRDQSLKKRYDYFYSNGFPKWKGTGYYYSRFRPGVILTLVCLYVLVGIFHYFSIKINRGQQYKRLVLLKLDIKNQAWNGSILPPSDGSDRKVVNPMSGKEFIVHNSGEVSVVEKNGDDTVLHLFDENQINSTAGFRDTLFYKLAVFVYNQSFGRVLGPIVPPQPQPPAQKLQESGPQTSSKPKTKKNKGEKIELPNGKVIYGRKRK